MSNSRPLLLPRSPTRIYPDADYEATGCEMAENMAFMELGADPDTLVVGLKVGISEVTSACNIVRWQNGIVTHIGPFVGVSYY